MMDYFAVEGGRPLEGRVFVHGAKNSALPLLAATLLAGRTVVLITHNSAFADIADRVIHVREGRVASCYINPHPGNAADLEW